MLIEAFKEETIIINIRGRDWSSIELHVIL
jgi:hypothetical protein